MPDIIRLLPDHVANQIAAGEVVQRPASIVKELLENAIDAGATSIELIVKDGGRTLVQVVDNGSGMSATDARLAFERHATSKIRTTEDIFRIATKGFRGEALASIAAVAQVDLKTKQADTSYGTHIMIHGGELIEQELVQSTDGSNFAVKNLFYNVPARRKFLKSDNVEIRHIMDEFQRVALAHPGLEFSLYNNDSEVFRLRKSTELQRIVDIFGRRLHSLLVPIKEETDWVRLSGYVGKPEAARKNRGEQFFFVNGRYFKSPYLSRAVQEAFEGLLQPQYIPSYFLFLEIDPEKIDVNIHPQKTEVKFEDENVIFAMLRSSIKRSLGIYNISPSLDFDREPMHDEMIVSRSPSDRVVIPTIQVDRNYNPFREETTTPKPQEIVSLTEMYQTSVSPSPSKINLFDEDDTEDELMRLPNGFWLYNHNNKTLMLDLGRMHQLVLYERKQKKKTSQTHSQKLLFSHEIYLNEIEKMTYLAVREKLIEIGFDMNLDASEHILHVHAVPEDLSDKDVIPLLQKIFAEYEDESLDFFEFFESKQVKLQSKSNFDFHQKEDVESLIQDFSALGFPEYNHNKKKCYIELPIEELKNKLKM
ncbi:DNA mismatch repair endonuclease MutL [Elizabethkingia anophelis]|uniref:DNA mismatch repair protein MutL n=1 Tax=Elizabethkingia anophelis NUHP1 TaxID=1338011 RepID=A0A077EMQ4_9FLAO|nr:DNA mismatch repair endonuclease MutL [Elizabethkingia anophelis]AIL47743.1 DNA mismatch repair protein MutL [Elizabethkingia anophelis NUHP1]MBE9392962.1 DNA mismatch repair endonuclease MutL [Elizabethkingia anophelis]MBE9408025.1 DNA mismatch repair endonuclease MutL [Elizabethkingia anophelis]BBQ07192.1 DNA mismatch repair protein MutL [Elizabethkingia anophelis]